MFRSRPDPAVAGAPPSRRPRPRAPGGARALTGAMALCVALVVGMVSAVNLAIPSLSRSALHPSASAVLWVVDGYVAVFACLLVPAGALADRLGRKGVLLSGLGVFAGGCLLAGAAPSTAVLIAGRTVSGVGAAAVLPSTLALLVDGVPSALRPRRIAAWAAMTGLAAVLGNVGGGAALQSGSWRVLFLAAVPLAAAALVLVAAVAPRSAPYDRPVAPVSALLLTGAFLTLLFGVVSGPQRGWDSLAVLGPFAAAALLGVCWVRRELRSAQPLLDPRLLAGRPARAGALGMMLVFTGMFGLFYLNGQYLQYAKGYSPLGSGIRLLPMAAALLLAPRCAVPLQRRLGERQVVALGVLLRGRAGHRVPRRRLDAVPVYAVGAGLTAAGCGLATPVLSAP